MTPVRFRFYPPRIVLALLQFGLACTPINDPSAPKNGSIANTANEPSETAAAGAMSRTDAGASSPGETRGVMTMANGVSAMMMSAPMPGDHPCANRETGDPYCDADAMMHMCTSKTASRAIMCGEHERCVEIGGRAQCRCVPGAVMRDTACELGTSCTVQNGGCDPMTMCIADSSGRSCGECPGGYLGDGLSGCAPQLNVLQPSCGVIDPPLAAGIYEYTLRVPLDCLSLHFESSAPEGTTVAANGAQLDPEASWSVVPVKLGQTLLPITVTSEFAVTSKYSIELERSGAQEAYIKASNGDADDAFGTSVAMTGDVVFAGAPSEDSASHDPADNNAANSGAVYAYTRQASGWKELAYLKPEQVVAGEYFGWSVAASGDTLVVGAPNVDPGQWFLGTTLATRPGAVYVFTQQNGVWTQTARLTPSTGMAEDMFGFRIALKDDTLLVGAPGDAAGGVKNRGAAYVFQRQGTMWSEAQKLQAPMLGRSAFGMGVGLSADHIAVGAPQDSTRSSRAGAAYVFAREGALWNTMPQRIEARSPKVDAMFGWHVAVHADTVAVSAPAVVREGPPGEMSIFELGMGVWTQRDTKAAAYPTGGDLFGSAILLSDDMMIVGANGDSSGATGIDGDAARTDVYQSGAAYLYARTDTGWVPSMYLKASNPDESDYFGMSVATGADHTLVIGASAESGASRAINGDPSSNGISHSGAVYVFR